MALRKACGRESVQSGEMTAVPVGRRRVLLVETGGILCAYEDRCAHKGVPLSEGVLAGTTLTCTAHHWTYDTVTGRGINPDSAALVPVPFEIVDGTIWIEDGERADRRAAVDAPAVAPPSPPARTGGTMPPGAGSPAEDAERGLVGPRPRASSTAGRVGPVLLAGVVTDAVIDAIREVHANVQIVDQGSYLRVLVPERCVIRAEAVRARLHAPFHIPSDLEPLMCSFKGVFTASEDEAVFEAKRRS